MTATCAPTNTSLLNPNEFRFVLHKAPYLSFFVQTVALPSINLGVIEDSNPFTSLRVPGDHIIWDALSVVFLVDEDLQGWMEMYDWIRGMGFPTTFEEYQSLRRDGDNKYKSDWDALTSDISVFTNTGHRNANIEYTFRDAWPSMISAPTLSTTNPDQPVVTAKVLFQYNYYDVKPVNIT